MTKKSFPPPRHTPAIQPNQDFPKSQEQTPNPTIEATLAERGARYGEFKDHAKIAMLLKYSMRYDTTGAYKYEDLNLFDGKKHVSAEIRPGWARLDPDQAQALDTICDKIARILNGDPNYDDNWRDISGYATLVLNRILKEQSK